MGRRTLVDCFEPTALGTVGRVVRNIAAAMVDECTCSKPLASSAC